MTTEILGVAAVNIMDVLEAKPAPPPPPPPLLALISPPPPPPPTNWMSTKRAPAGTDTLVVPTVVTSIATGVISGGMNRIGVSMDGFGGQGHKGTAHEQERCDMIIDGVW